MNDVFEIGKPKILLVDDIEQNLMLVESMLEILDVEIICANNGYKAIELIQNNEFAIVLIDVQMPEIDGYETVNIINTIPTVKNLPIIFISAVYNDDYYKIKGIQTGAIDFISKPIVAEILLGKVKLFLDHYKYKKQLEIYKTHLQKLVDEKTIDLLNTNKKLENEISERIETEKQLKSAKEKAEESDRLKTAFLANLSHEIRTPLNAITGFSNLLTYHGLTELQQQEYIQYINQNSDLLLKMIDSIVDIAKLESGDLKIVYNNFELGSFLTRIYSNFKNNILPNINREIQFRLSIEPGTENFSLFSSEEEIKKVITNLLDNSIKFTNTGFIELGCSFKPEDKMIVFFIRDTGIGISPNYINRIFDKFYKVKNQEDKLYSGTGIGLYFCKKIVNILGGSIWVESKENEGSVFYFTIPVK